MMELQSLTVTVDRTKSFIDMLGAGEYDYMNVGSEGFLGDNTSAGEIEIILAHFGHSITSDDVVRRLWRKKFNPCRIRCMLALGAEYKDLQRRFPIVGLGSSRTVDRCVHVPCLDRHFGGRVLRLESLVREWNGRCYFAAVRVDDLANWSYRWP